MSTHTDTPEKKTKATPADVVTDKLIERIEEERNVPWRKPFHSLGLAPANLKSKREYTGFNRMLLSFLGYADPFFLTWKQVQELGGSVIEAEAKKSIPVILWKQGAVKVAKETPGASYNPTKKRWEKKTLITRYYRVYNVEQTEGLTHLIPEKPELVTPEPDAAAQAVIDQLTAYYTREGVTLKHGGDRACYSPLLDEVRMPLLEQFESMLAYASTDAHEAAHTTGAAKRLNRKEIAGMTFGNTFGSEPYALEELVAEITAAMVCAEMGCQVNIESSASYLENWLKALRDDRKMIITAAQRAQKACNLIMNWENPVYQEEAAPSSSTED